MKFGGIPSARISSSWENGRGKKINVLGETECWGIEASSSVKDELVGIFTRLGRILLLSGGVLSLF